MLVLLVEVIRKKEAIVLDIELDVQYTLSLSLSCTKRCTFLSILIEKA